MTPRRISNRFSVMGRTQPRSVRERARVMADAVLETVDEEKSKNFPIQVACRDGTKHDFGEMTKPALTRALTTRVVIAVHINGQVDMKKTSSR